jgi:hypothetical protein
MATKNKYAAFYSILKQVNTSGVAMSKSEAVKGFTNGRTDSLSSLSDWELQELQRNLSSLTVPKPKSAHHGGTRNEMRRAIISQFKGIGKTTEDAIAWAEKYGVFGNKRAFNDYDEQELYQLIRNAEQMKADAIVSINKKLATNGLQS